MRIFSLLAFSLFVTSSVLAGVRDSEDFYNFVETVCRSNRYKCLDNDPLRSEDPDSYVQFKVAGVSNQVLKVTIDEFIAAKKLAREANINFSFNSMAPARGTGEEEGSLDSLDEDDTQTSNT